MVVGWLNRFGTRRPIEEAKPVEADRRVQAESVSHTKAFQKFIACVAGRPAPVVLDVGPVVGSNIAYFGDQLGCKIHVLDLYEDLERAVRAALPGGFTQTARTRLALPDASVDGVLCWDLLDYLERDAAHAVAADLTRLLKVNGALLGFFHPTPERQPFYVKHIIVDDATLSHRRYAASRTRQGGLQNRDVIKLFEGLRVSDSFLLKTNVREILFRKPSYLAGGGLGRRA